MKTSSRPSEAVVLFAASLIVSAIALVPPLALFGASGRNPVSSGPVVPAEWKEAAGTKKTMRSFASDEELQSYFRQLAVKRKREIAHYQYESSTSAGQAGLSDNEEPAATRSKEPEESITNTQHAGVDEGGIVKLQGDHLVILRRGRLFTVTIGDGALNPIAALDAFGPEIDPSSTWYDEMLVSEDTVAVIGYSYERGGTEVGLFRIDSAGNLTYRSTFHLRSNDYYSSRNYASRLIGHKLIFYTPLYCQPDDKDVFAQFPAVRKWHTGATPQEFQRIVSASHVYHPEGEPDSLVGLALHTVTVCDLSDGNFKCEATAVLGAPGRVFYVSPDAVYVWTTDGSGYGQQQIHRSSMLYRMPLDGSSPSAIAVSGSPVDQFSFLESDDNYLNVLVRSGSVGDGMWGAETADGDVALLRIPLARFNDGSIAATSEDYRTLPKPSGYTFQNRFVGDYLLYGTGSGWEAPQGNRKSEVYAVHCADGNVTEMSLAHGVDRIEAMGPDAIVVGTDGDDLHFTAVWLGNSPKLAGEYTRRGASQGELRSHGFFYKADGRDSGVLGLPISVPGRAGYQHLFERSAAILFLRNQSLRFQELGELSAQSEKAVNDGCRASCVDWYGNSRPLFVRGRILALLGYEVVEGRWQDGRIQEMRRINYAPGPSQTARRG